MKTLAMNQRVVVKQTADGIALHAAGTVVRVRGDGGAFVRLDRRSRVEGAHPFGPEDSRGCDVRARPEDCELPARTGAERRAARRASGRRTPTLEDFGADHWSTFLYLASVAVGHSGVPENDRMRCDAARHPLLVGPVQRTMTAAPTSPTRMKGGARLADHDDWDCAADLATEGLLELGGTSLHPTVTLTQAGLRLVELLKRHRATGGKLEDFDGATVREATAT